MCPVYRSCILICATLVVGKDMNNPTDMKGVLEVPQLLFQICDFIMQSQNRGVVGGCLSPVLMWISNHNFNSRFLPQSIF